MAYIRYVPESELAEEKRVADPDNIIQIHSVHPAVMKAHYDLYINLMRRAGPLSRKLREMVAVVISGINSCHY